MIPRGIHLRTRRLRRGGARAHGPRRRLPLAGGHSLLPALKLRLSAPEALVDIARIPGLSGIRVDGGDARDRRLHAPRRDRASADVKAHAAALAAAAGEIGDQQVRNRGTIGGSLAQADPHGDLPAVALAVGAEIVVQAAAGTRTIAADDFFVDYFTTALEEGELITEIRIPGGQSQGGYAKFNRRTADWALDGGSRLEGRRRAGGSRCAARPPPPCARPASRPRSRPARRPRTPRPTRARASALRPTSAARRSTSATSRP